MTILFCLIFIFLMRNILFVLPYLIPTFVFTLLVLIFT